MTAPLRPRPTPGAAPSDPPKPFWRVKRLAEMTAPEWESLCDGCGRCCLLKLQDEDTDRIAYVDVSCRLFDRDTCRCSDYPRRAEKVPDCVTLTPGVVEQIGWLPPTCAYRLIEEGKDLPWWHPLVSGDPATVHAAGVSVRGKVFCSETEIAEEDLQDRMVSWPAKWPRGAKGRR
ncbi:YcgN family cysteine cluster protein [Methylopila turkensis]|uniref:YcgN family cysteine cluster protein n=1 Tax=Methylopila turkensis TaxID=1437816 RepID=UPI0022F2E1D9|nr:YcgN family cysteine cluster protein [Methylopila turkensis]